MTATASTFTRSGGSHSMLATATNAGAYATMTSTDYPRLLDLMDTTIDFKCWAYPSIASDVTILIQAIKADGTTQTLESTTTTYASKWNLITLEDQKLNDDLVYMVVQFRIATSGTTCYFDNAQLFGKPIEQYLCPTVIRNSKILGVYRQENPNTNQTIDPCDNANPAKWTRLYNWQYWSDGTYDWIEIPEQPERYKIRLMILSPLSQLSSGTDTIEIDGQRVNLLLAYAKYKLFQAERGLPSSQDTTRLTEMMGEALTEYKSLLPKQRIPQILETVRVRF
jgi:hypothetical protein